MDQKKTPKNQTLSAIQWAQTVTLYVEGYTELDISVQIGRGKTAVYNAIIRYQLDGTFFWEKEKWLLKKNNP